MDYLIPAAFYAMLGILLVASLFKSRKKTKIALDSSIKSFHDLAIIFLAVIIIFSVFELTLSSNILIDMVRGVSGLGGVLMAALAGSIIHIPPFIAFPVCGQLLDQGINPGVVAALVNTLIMVHTFTIPVEIKTMGWRFAVSRNILSLIGAIVVGILIGVLY